MKLLTYRQNGTDHVGILAGTDQIVPVKELGINCASMSELIEQTDDAGWESIKAKLAGGKFSTIPVDRVEKRAPIPYPRQDVICLGINYMAHAEESARYKLETFDGERQYPVYFSKRVTEANCDGGPVPAHADIEDRLDYEAELVVILKKDAKNVSEEDAFDYVLGYTVANDVSARVLQNRHKQWYFGKSLDGFFPMGPWIVTADEFAQPPVLKIQSRVNGELRQDSTTGLLIFGIAHVIHELSQGMTLKAGTIISMGTPAGVGIGFTPPKFLKSGDIVECSIEGIGTLTNPID